MGIRKIISFIEILNNNELKRLTVYLNEKIDINQYPPKIQRLIEEGNVEEIAKLIEKGEIEATKDLLMLQDKDGNSVAYVFAYYSGKTGWSIDDKKILMLQNNEGRSVAYKLAFHSDKTKWATNDKDILMLQDKYGWSVAHELAENHPTWTTDDPEILNLKDNHKVTVKDVLKDKGKI